MAIRTIDPMAVCSEINLLAQRLGSIEGQARERGYPLIADVKLVDCSELVLSNFKKNKGMLSQMGSSLDAVYLKLGSVSTDVEGIESLEIKNIFKEQIKQLHEKRGVLNNSLCAFGKLLSLHAFIDEIAAGTTSVEEQVDLFEQGKMQMQSWEKINHSIENLLLRLRVALPDEDVSCKLHDEAKKEMRDTLLRCQYRLNLKHSELKEQSSSQCKSNLTGLLVNLNRLRKTKVSDDDVESVQKLFSALPLDLRAVIFGRRKILPEDQVRNTEIVFTPPKKGGAPELRVEIRRLSDYDRQRNFELFEKPMNELLDRWMNDGKAVVSERELARKSLNHFVSQLPEGEIRNPKLLLEALGGICKSSEPEIEKIISACEKGFDALDKEEFDLTLRSVPVFSSLKMVKEQVEAYQAARMYDDVQKESLVAALLEAAEGKGGVSLDVDKGVYYWVWFLAHEKDPSVGGDRFGKVHAPKDLDRLIEALKRAMPPAQVAPQVPIITIPPVEQRSAHRAPRPSEVRLSERKTASVFTEVKVKCKVLLGHFLSIKGEGGNLSWTEGKRLVKVDEETYVHRMEGVSGRVNYKILLDDVEYEGGGNRLIEAQKSEEIVPNLQMPKCRAIVDVAPKDGKLFACGTAPGMSWDQNKKIELKKVGGKYVIETRADIGSFEFKVLLSDNQWSKGENFKVQNGVLLQVKPQF